MQTENSRLFSAREALDSRFEQELRDLTGEAEGKTQDSVLQAKNEDKYRELESGLVAWTEGVCACITKWYWTAFDLAQANESELENDWTVDGWANTLVRMTLSRFLGFDPPLDLEVHKRSPQKTRVRQFIHWVGGCWCDVAETAECDAFCLPWWAKGQDFVESLLQNPFEPPNGDDNACITREETLNRIFWAENAFSVKVEKLLQVLAADGHIREASRPAHQSFAADSPLELLALGKTNLTRIPQSFRQTHDPIEGNPFSKDNPRHEVWEKATKRAEELVCRLNAEHLAAPHVTGGDLAAGQIALFSKKFDIWAERYIQIVWSDADVRGYDEWLCNFAEAWLQLTADNGRTPIHQETFLNILRTALLARVEWWKAEARRFVALQKEHLAKLATESTKPSTKTVSVLASRRR
jgi:hypothetical protein